MTGGFQDASVQCFLNLFHELHLTQRVNMYAWKDLEICLPDRVLSKSYKFYIKIHVNAAFYSVKYLFQYF